MMFWVPVLLIVVVWMWPGIWFRLVREKIEVQVHLDTTQVEFGGEIPVTVTLRNKSWFPCPHVEVIVDLPPGLSANASTAERLLRWKTYLFMRQELTVTLFCYGLQRGLHQLGQRDVVIHLNEGFGLRDLFLRKTIEQEVVVLPQRQMPVPVAPMMDALVGNLEVRRWLHPDEAMLRGIRQYQVGDSHRHIAWLATARTGQWMTKEFSTTTEIIVTLLFNAQFFDVPWMGTEPEAFDELCSVTAAVARTLAHHHIPVQFGSNASNPRQPFTRWYGKQNAHGIEVLLGRFNPLARGDFSLLLQRGQSHPDTHNPLIVAARFFTPLQVKLLQHHAKSGRNVTVVWTGDKAFVRTLQSAGLQVIEVHLPPQGEEVSQDVIAAD